MHGQKKTRSTVASLVAALGVALIPALIISPLYAVASWYSPTVILNVVYTVAAAGIAGWIVAKSAIAWVIPSRPLVVVLGLMIGAVVLYGSWSTNAILRIPGIVFLALDPRFLAEFAHQLYLHCPLTIAGENGNQTFKESSLAGLWIVEGVALVAGPAVVAAMFVKAQAPPLCPECRVWKTGKQGLLRFGLPEDLPGFVDCFQTGDGSCLNDLPDGSVDDDPHLRIDGAWCPACNGGCTVRVSVISYSSNPTEACICSRADFPTAAFTDVLARSMAQAEEDGESQSQSDESEDAST